MFPRRVAISYLYISLLVYEQVFRFQVSVDQVQSVQVLEGQDYLSSVEAGVRLTAQTAQKGGQKVSKTAT